MKRNALLVAVALAGVSGAGIAGRAAAGSFTLGREPSLTAAAPAESTTLTLVMSRCEGCRIDAFHVVAGQVSDAPVAGATVRAGRATFIVPTALTRGMAFQFASTDPYPMVDSRPEIVIETEGVPVGAPVTDAQAMAARGANVCWAGTTGRTFTIRVSTLVYATRDQANKPVHSIAFWASPNQHGYGSFGVAGSHYGGIESVGGQDVPVCSTKDGRPLPH